MTKKNKAFNATSYVFKEDEHILNDANIWLYLQPPTAQPTPTWAAGYSSVFANLLKARAVPIIDAFVLSEYINRYLRLEYIAQWSAAYPKFKDFRQSAEGLGIAQHAVADVHTILRSACPRDTQLQHIDLARVLSQTASGQADFNDGVLVENCRLQGWKLLTHDADMTIGGINVLTNSQKLLRNCR
ncbi:hypothetical protein [Pusillimonas noertemannii]|uniref:hypothetical protein n=1 Tax=Pusillimonas noertemannii TaxID=305977 RepID=UPI00037C563D|nr:hypothetical protein [Pusillimonas noertemannii]